MSRASIKAAAVESQGPLLDTRVRPIRVSGKALLNRRWEYLAEAA